ncbi:carboxymuconolactone decarboxylase family protein [Robiginitalea sp. IMCC44478]|uniref:carboxymuconolactone decarboxylase family protein n=1 Tax=Robiginitalea sp. IMCC44478 TaxID=3459122 RepID=UPI0040411660
MKFAEAKEYAVKTCLALFLAVVLAFQSNAQSGIGQATGLSDQEKSLIKIASYTAQGNLTNLKDALNEGLDNGLTVNETKEALVHLYAYTGFPRSIRGLQTFLEVLDTRKAKGITDTLGKEASPIINSGTKYERGKAILEELIGAPLDGKPAYQEFSPEMDAFLKEHLFADIFERDVLNYKQRELVTISVIASLGTLEPMLRSHFGLSLNVGWNPDQLMEFTKLIEATAGKEKSKSALVVLRPILEGRSE